MLEREIEKEYKQAYEELAKKADKYFEKYAELDKKKAQMVKDEKMTFAEYREWRKNKMLIGKRWNNLRDTLAQDLTNVDKIAMQYINETTPNVYALNANYATYQIEHQSSIDTSFTLYNKDTVKRLIKDKPDLLPQPRVNIPLDLRWNKQHITSQITQGILQGESITKIADRLQNVTDMDKKAAVRNARTMVTSAQNSGRMYSYDRAESMGIALKKVWMATLDDRTRESHVELDGEERDINEEFSNGLMYPADPSGDPSEVYNCRCRMVTQIDKYKTDWTDLKNRNDDKLGGMSYDEWKNRHKEDNEDD